MPGNRGTIRQSKLPALTEEDEYPEQLSSIMDKKVEDLELKAVGYLERELTILTSTPGNFAEVARILKILKEHKGGVQSDSSGAQQSWSLDG